MTKPISRKMAVDALLFWARRHSRTRMVDGNGEYVLLCPICGEPLEPGQAIQFDHHHADGMGGPHEYQNLRPIHYDPCHKKKSKKDAAALAKVARITGKTKTKPKRRIPSPKKPWPKRPMRNK